MQRLCATECCTGCGACANICPKGCIHMEADAEGFLYPRIDETLCISCNRCSTVCPILSRSSETPLDAPKAYAAHNLDENIVGSSSSGGVFTALAQNVLAEGGVVYGAAFRENFSVAHCRAETADQLYTFRGSKYTQSDVALSYQQVRDDLNAGRKVLFSGTPCQVAGLRCFLGKDYSDLLCVDIICHSVPSPKVWQEYLRELQEKADEKITSASFRDKRENWKGYYLRIGFADGREDLRRGNDNYYMKAFIQGLSTRQSCYNCSFKGQNRGSDITLGDFWGIENVCPEVFYDKGTSLVLIQSEKGQMVFEKIASRLEILEVNSSAALQGNPAYNQVFLPHRNREIFFWALGQEPLEQLVTRLLAPTKKELLRHKWNGSLLCRGLRKIKHIISK